MAKSTSPRAKKTFPDSARGDRSDQIMRAAMLLFQSRGYQNVSIDQIGAAVGLTGPAVYRHFKGKHDILVRALEAQSAKVDALFETASARASGQERLDYYLRRMSEYTANNDEATLWRREQQHLAPDARSRFREVFRKTQEQISEMLRAADPAMSANQAQLLGAAVLSMFSNTPNIRGQLTTERLIQVQEAVCRSIITTSLPEPGPHSVSAGPLVPRRPAGRRERILEASAQLFYERGFCAVSIDDIAKAAELSVATLYQNVPGKTQVLKAVLERGAEGLLYVTADALAVANTASEVLDALIRTYIRQALGVHGRIMHILSNDFIYLSEEDQAALRATQREYVAEWIEAIRALNDTLTPADARALAQGVISVVTDIIQDPVLRARPGIADELTALSHAMVLPEGLDQPSA